MANWPATDVFPTSNTHPHRSQRRTRGAQSEGGDGIGSDGTGMDDYWNVAEALYMGLDDTQQANSSNDSADAFLEAALQQQTPWSMHPIQSSPAHAPPSIVLFETESKESSGQENSSTGNDARRNSNTQAKSKRKKKNNTSAASQQATQQKTSTCRRSEEAEKQLQVLLAQEKKDQAVNMQLKQNMSFLLGWQKQLEIEQSLLSIVHRAPSPARKIPSSCSLVSFSQLPHPSLWDDAWVARVRSLSCQDLLVLRRQWLHQSSILLPAAEMWGQGSEAYAKLDVLHSKHIAFVQSVVTLMPETWLQMSSYDMESLQPIAALDRTWLNFVFHRMFPPSIVDAALSLSTQYHAQTQLLNQELNVLLRQYQTLAAGMGLQRTSQKDLPVGYSKLPVSCGSGCAPTLSFELPGGASVVTAEDDVVTELDAVTRLIEGNTRKQLALLKQFLCRMQHSRQPADNVKLALTMYPLAANALDLSRGLLPSE